ncbi:MAG: ATPase [Verrucomicrobia bacterium RIFCSPHIGHO2_12_FULL_41_10]|nr:MAG: ATPase [Verrucomicrobia bacterium RIFCSPHIGHO2_12_FULL_41_10]
MESILQTLQEEFHAALSLTKKSTPRLYKFPEAKNLIKVAVGMRRSGKTYFLFQTIRELLSKNIPLERILYLNFEDDRILPMDHKAMGKLIDSWYTLYPQHHDQECYLFLDEVQNVEEWPLVLRRMLDTKNIQIYATGSSAKLLSKEIATSLRGRSLSIEISPYSYLEYLMAHDQELPVKPFGQKSLDYHRKYLLEYFHSGGFPGIQLMQQNEKLETLQGYVETVIFRDVIERHKISNVSLMKYMISFLLKNIATPFSINKFHNDIKSQGHKAGKDTLYSYLDYLEDAFLIFTVPIFTESLRHRQTTPKKIYAIDNGLVLANTFNLSDNFGKLLENQVYLDLRREGKKIFYYHTSEGYEIDFLTQDTQGKYEMIQVVWDTSDPKTLQREQRALDQAEKELGFPGRLLDYTHYLRRFSD